MSWNIDLQADAYATGPQGPASDLAVGTVTTGAAGTQAGATITGVAPDFTLDLTIPKGDPGGWVASATHSGNFNANLTPGLYFVSSATSTTANNSPSNGVGGHLEVVAGSGSLLQRYTDHNATSWTRTSVNGGSAWAAWVLALNPTQGDARYPVGAGGVTVPAAMTNIMPAPKGRTAAEWTGSQATVTALANSEGLRYQPTGAGTWSTANLNITGVLGAGNRIPITPGTTHITIGLDMRTNGPTTFNMQVSCVDAGGASLGNASFACDAPMVANQWTRARVVVALKAGTTALTAFQIVGTINAADIFDFRDVVVHEGTVADVAYFDGDTPGSRWTGAASKSSSQRMFLPRSYADAQAKASVADHVTVADPHTQYARKAAANTFTTGQTIDTPSGQLTLARTNGTADARRWMEYVETDGTIRFVPVTDAGVGNGTTVMFLREGTIMQGNVRNMVGNGSPEGVFSAVAGSRFVDQSATNGAVEWIKASGAGSTGWRVSHGDTGWRDLTATVDATKWNPTATATNYVLVRRINDVVHLRVELARVLASGSRDAAIEGIVCSLPTGFAVSSSRGPAFAMLSATPWYQAARFEASNDVRIMGTSGTWAAGDRVQLTVTIPQTSASVAWPTALPGVAG